MSFPKISMLKIEYNNKWIDDEFMINRVKNKKNTEEEFEEVTEKSYTKATANEN